MFESFGARLRQRREAQDIALVAVAKQTKIKLSLLEALERDEVSQWPSGFYRRAFIRAYADAIGLNPDEVVREFQEAHPEPTESIPAVPAAPMWTEEPLTDGGPPTRLRYLVGSAIGRLRRGRVIEERVAANGAFSVVGVPAEPHRSGPSQEPMETARPDEGAPEDGPVAGDFAIEADSPEETAPTAQTTETPRVDEPSRHDPEARPDFLAVAQLCTELGRVDNIDEMQPILAEAVRILDAVGLIVWVWDAPASELRPALASGYSDKMLAQLPTVKRDADNPTAAAFRSQRTFEINGTGHTRGALVIPLLTPAGCAGVLALELRQGLEATTTFSRATATIFAALVAQLVGAPPAVMEQPEIVAAVRSG